MPDVYTLTDHRPGWSDRIPLGEFDSFAAAIAASKYPDPADWWRSGQDMILTDLACRRIRRKHSPYGIERSWRLDPPREPRKDVDIDAEAWRLLLAGAESHVEDAIDEDGDFAEADYDRITARAMELINQLRTEHL